MFHRKCVDSLPAQACKGKQEPPSSSCQGKGRSIKGYTEEGSNAQEKWNANFEAFVKFSGMPKQITPGVGTWINSQQKRLRDMAKKDKFWADNLAKLLMRFSTVSF